MFQISCSNKNIISRIRHECYEMNTLLNFFVYKYEVKREFFTEKALHPGKERRNL